MTTLNLEKADYVATLTISRPESLNALNKQVMFELNEALGSLAEDKSCKVLVVRGSGEKAFVAGADIKEMMNLGVEEACELSERGQRVFSRLSELPQVSIACVNGFALGGGLELALACDFIVASSKAKFGLPEVSLGLLPGYGGTQRLARTCGMNWARRLIFSGEIISAEQAARAGLVTEVFEPTELIEKTLTLARVLASRSSSAIASAKSAVQKGFDLSLSAGLEIEANAFAKCFAHPDSREGISAFVEKRKANFL